MATVTARTAFDMSADITGLFTTGDIVGATNTKIEYALDDARIVFLGDFQYAGGQLAGGTFDTISGSVGGVLQARITDCNLDVADVNAFLATEDFAGLAAHFFRGDDTFIGSSDDDFFIGGAGNDVMLGGAGNDRLVGDSGKDTLNGGNGADTLTGRGGADTFVFSSPIGNGRPSDIVTDFNIDWDTIQLDDAIFTNLVAGALSAENFRANSSGRARDADDFIVYETDTGELYYDANGDAAGGMDLIAVLGRHPAGVTAADFVVV